MLKSSELQAAEELVERHAEADEELAELGVLGAHFIEAHFVDDLADVEGVVREEGHAPLGVIEAGGAGDELEDFAVIGAAEPAVAGHEFLALFEGEGVPVLTRNAAAF